MPTTTATATATAEAMMGMMIGHLTIPEEFQPSLLTLSKNKKKTKSLKSKWKT
jgi:hypothetical protein